MIVFVMFQCHQNLGDIEKAKEWWRKSLELPVKDYDVILAPFIIALNGPFPFYMKFEKNTK